MVARVRSSHQEKPEAKPKGKHGGARKNGGRKKGTLNRFNLHAVREAKARGSKLPHELLLEWANTGVMTNGHKATVELDPSQRIQCTVAAAPYYGQKLAPKQVGDQPTVTRLEIDVAALKGLPLDQLQMMREVLQMMAKGLPSMSELQVPGRADPSRFAASLRPDSATEGRA